MYARDLCEAGVQCIYVYMYAYIRVSDMHVNHSYIHAMLILKVIIYFVFLMHVFG